MKVSTTVNTQREESHRKAGSQLEMPHYTSNSQKRAAAVFSESGDSGKLSYPEFSRLINLDFLHLPGRIHKDSH
ncbi:hypothetical protein AMELA_G00058190 [Ameiurus melas]|uniref:EF-hand domain-containing protein n=1 Tax=Ameiurus melas TaxID=219545 RepID=A0A7J6B0T6_AMEME|nr:hypothetical protein AMELA_G00058190 [Ameiurus melas]